MSDYVTDTHALIWYLENSPRLGSQARAAFDACDQGEARIYCRQSALLRLCIWWRKDAFHLK